MSRMNHRNICKYIDSFTQGNMLYLVMEYCDKGDLAQYLQRMKDMAQSVLIGSKAISSPKNAGSSSCLTEIGE